MISFLYKQFPQPGEKFFSQSHGYTNILNLTYSLLFLIVARNRRDMSN